MVMTIYVIENLLNGKKYVGKTIKPINKRFIEHCSLAKKYPNKGYICRAINKYGSDNFKIYKIDHAETEEELNQKEVYWIKKLKTLGEGYNLTEGGEGISGKVFSEESKRKMSLAHKGVKLSEEHRRKIGEGHKGIVFSKERKQNISKALTGRKGTPLSEEAKAKLSARFKGKIFSEETKKKISQSKIGHIVSEESRSKMKQSKLGRKRVYREDGTFYMTPKVTK